MFYCLVDVREAVSVHPVLVSSGASVLGESLGCRLGLDLHDGRLGVGLDRLEAALARDGAWSVGAYAHDAVRAHAHLAAEQARLALDHRADEVVVEARRRLDDVVSRAEATAPEIAAGFPPACARTAVLQAKAERTWMTGVPDPDASRRDRGVPGGQRGPRPPGSRAAAGRGAGADGRTNREIGEQLFIAEKTASVHVSNILAKLGVTNRGEAAAVAHRAGLAAEATSRPPAAARRRP